ncbi:MAG: hypothetical protein AABZ18_03315, partial [Pseudomonadota bacterium]
QKKLRTVYKLISNASFDSVIPEIPAVDVMFEDEVDPAWLFTECTPVIGTYVSTFADPLADPIRT